MKSTLKNEEGFTLIELIMVIVILGILAATAVPKFIDLRADAVDARRDNLTGALRASVNILHANYILRNNSTYDVTAIVGSVDAQGLTPVAASATSVTAEADGVTYSWSFTPHGGIQDPATIGDPGTL
jgi:prepilin-type N-terminal cleavage/methylation domain-containing protein|tara:strand:+ start:224 stop:607 length:384 start_codon:yes stop_codon:yes gene_type:complete